MRRAIRWAPAVAQSVAWCGIALIGVTLAIAQIDQAGKKQAPKNGERAADKAAPRAAEPGREQPAQPERRAAPRRGEGRAAEQPPADREGTARRERDDQPRGEEARRRPAGLGMSIEEQDEGLAVTNVEPDSGAAQAGFRVNDRIVSADGRRFTNPRQMQAYLGGQIGRRVPIIIDRGGRQYTIQFMPSGGDEGAWLGVFMEDDDENKIGARVTHVYPTSPAARAGFWPGDVILEVNAQPVKSSPDVIALVEAQEPGSRADFVVRRNDQEVKLTTTLGRRDAFVSYARGQQSDRFERQEGEFNDDDPYSRVPPYVMQLEHDRRNAEQHQRIEQALRDLQEEVKQLRAEIEKKR